MRVCIKGQYSFGEVLLMLLDREYKKVNMEEEAISKEVGKYPYQQIYEVG